MPWINKQIVQTQTKVLSIAAKNTTGASIPVGKAVYITGSQGSLATIALADNDGDLSSSKTVGLLAKNVAINATVEVIMKGKYKFNGFNTNAFTEGTSLWLGDDGNLLQAPPVSPKHAVFIGYLEIKGNNSTIIVDVQNGFELGELHDVLISSPVDNEVLTYESGLWKNKPASGGGAETFETVSKNLKSYPASYNYTSGLLTSIVYTVWAGTITKTFNYTSGLLTSIVLSWNTPSGIDLTKTLTYTSGNLTNLTYS